MSVRNIYFEKWLKKHGRYKIVHNNDSSKTCLHFRKLNFLQQVIV